MTDSGFLCPIRQDFVSDDTRIEVHLEHSPVAHLVLAHQLLLTSLRIHIHAAEFIYFESFSVSSYPFLREEDRSRRTDIDCRCYEQE